MNKISVIVPIYNVDKYLEKCIKSIINQTYKNLEIVLVDDGSTDGSPKICDEYAAKDKRVKVFHGQNRGQSYAKNFGFSKATGDFISFIDSDDYLEPTMYEMLIKTIDEQNCDVAIARYNKIVNGKKFAVYEQKLKTFCSEKKLKNLIVRSQPKTRAALIEQKNVSCYLWRMLFSRKIIGNTFFNESIRFMEDLVYFVRVLQNNPKICLTDEYVYNYICRTGSESNKHLLDTNNQIAIINDLSQIQNSKIDLQHLIKALKYYFYVDLYMISLASNQYNNLTKQIADWAAKENYMAAQKLSDSVKIKILNYLVYHKNNKIINVLKKK